MVARIGVLGGGQLGRMLALAGPPIGLRCLCVDPDVAPPCAWAAEHVQRSVDDPDLPSLLDGRVDLLTYEVEHLPIASLRKLEQRFTLRPSVRAVEIAGDRWLEKTFLQDLGLPTAPFAAIDTPEDAREAVERTGAPAILKTRRWGYDGKGQRRIGSVDEAHDAAVALAVPAIAEGFVEFSRELSIVAARGLDGSIRCYPLVENVHREGILRLTRAPATGVTPELQARAEALVTKVLEAFDYVGVIAAELFEVGDELYVNELAPRVHNSGHWTIEGAHTSQFEQHLRAIAGFPLGSSAARGVSAMVNLIGELVDRDAVLAIEGAHLHLYDKSPRPGRKLGHITFVATDATELRARIAQLPEPLRSASLADFDGTR
ncbi:MAG: 5-(carboxyamino)imidazole ribonucleotide synthase [Sandaracinus sp.]|nr:5-(carboxyamino)imidazole ribonucleotide synthase [Sandaracinus sp.]